MITLDYECYYDQDYTLKKMATSAYVRDERFLTWGVGVSVDGAPTEYLYGTQIRHLKDFQFERDELLCHHTHFDGLILSYHHGIIPAQYNCTISMANAIHQGSEPVSLDHLAQLHGVGVKGKELESFKGIRELDDEQQAILGGYCKNDVDLTTGLGTVFRPQFSQDELDLIHLTILMFCVPVLEVDIRRARRALIAEQAMKARLIAATGYTAKQLGSNPQFAAILESFGVSPPMKPSPSDPRKQTFAFAKDDIGFQALHRNPDIRHIVQAREAVKSSIGESRALRLIEHGTPPFKLPIYLNYAKAHTGRWSGGDLMNPQNFTRGGELRLSIMAALGYVLVVVDSAQIEARTLAWMVGEEWLVEAFRQGRDIYSEFASSIYGYKVERKKNPDHFIQGFVGKVAVLGLGYSMGHVKFQDTLEAGAMGGPPVFLEPNQYPYIVQLFRATNPKIKESWNIAGDMIHIMADPNGHAEMWGCTFTHECVTLPSGRKLKYPGLACDHNLQYSYRQARGSSYLRTKIYGGLLIENIVQAIARDVVAWQMLRISKYARVVLTTHDEVVAVSTEQWAEHCYHRMMDDMRTTPPWAEGLPLDAEGGWAREYSK